MAVQVQQQTVAFMALSQVLQYKQALMMLGSLSCHPRQCENKVYFLYCSPQEEKGEDLFKNQCIFSLSNALFILLTSIFDYY